MLGLITAGAVAPLSSFFLLVVLLGNFLLAHPWRSISLLAIEEEWRYLRGVRWSLSLITVIVFFLATLEMLKSKNLFSLVFWSNLLLSLVLFIFYSKSVLIFYVCFEVRVFPIFLIILGWGYQPERVVASFYILVYTVLSALPILTYILLNWYFLKFLYFGHMNRKIIEGELTGILMLLPVLSFLIKLPVYGGHYWLPRAHVEAPVFGSMILAGVLLKLGGYGLLKLAFLVGGKSRRLVITWGLAGGVLVRGICLVQTDFKSLVAYSSVAHISFIVYLAFTPSNISLVAILLVILSHGFSSSFIFLCSFFFYKRLNTRNLMISANFMTFDSFFIYVFFLGVLGFIGAPPTFNFIREVFSILEILQLKQFLLFTFLGILLFISVAYALILFILRAHGPHREASLSWPGQESFNLLGAVIHLILITVFFPIFSVFIM